MLILLSGPIGSGKTTLCQRLVAAAREQGVDVRGVLTPALVRDGHKVGIQAVDLHSGEMRLLARTDCDLGGVQVGPYSFDDRTLAWMASLDADALPSEALVFVDEIGRLELHRRGGLAGLIPLLSQPRGGHTVVLVRDSLLDELLARVGQAQPRVVLMDAGCRERAWKAARSLLFPDVS